MKAWKHVRPMGRSLRGADLSKLNTARLGMLSRIEPNDIRRGRMIELPSGTYKGQTWPMIREVKFTDDEKNRMAICIRQIAVEALKVR